MPTEIGVEFLGVFLGALLGAALGQTFAYYRGQRERYEELQNTLARISDLDKFGTYRETLPVLKMEIRHNYRENISNLDSDERDEILRVLQAFDRIPKSSSKITGKIGPSPTDDRAKQLKETAEAAADKLSPPTFWSVILRFISP